MYFCLNFKFPRRYSSSHITDCRGVLVIECWVTTYTQTQQLKTMRTDDLAASVGWVSRSSLAEWFWLRVSSSVSVSHQPGLASLNTGLELWDMLPRALVWLLAVDFTTNLLTGLLTIWLPPRVCDDREREREGERESEGEREAAAFF